MLTFDKYTTLELLRLILATTLDEKLMVQTWRLFRSIHKGPLFAVPTTLTDRKHAAELNGFIIEELRERGTTVADIIRITGLHRSTVQKHLARFSALTLDQADERRYQRQRLMTHADNVALARMVDRQAAVVSAHRERSRPRL